MGTSNSVSAACFSDGFRSRLAFLVPKVRRFLRGLSKETIENYRQSVCIRNENGLPHKEAVVNDQRPYEVDEAAAVYKFIAAPPFLSASFIRVVTRFAFLTR